MTKASRRRKPAGASLCLPKAPVGSTRPRRGVRPSPPPCHGGDRGFESHRGRFLESESGTVRKLAKRRSSNLRDLWVRLPLVPLTEGRAIRPQRPAEPFSVLRRQRLSGNFALPERVATNRVGWALARPSGCNPPASRQCRFDSCPTHW
jgi:hypothetical protein